MPRLPIVILTWTLFAAVMLAIGWVLKQVVPPFSGWLSGNLGQPFSLVLILVLGLACGTFGLWPRDANGRMKRLPARR